MKGARSPRSCWSAYRLAAVGLCLGLVPFAISQEPSSSQPKIGTVVFDSFPDPNVTQAQAGGQPPTGPSAVQPTPTEPAAQPAPIQPSPAEAGAAAPTAAGLQAVTAPLGGVGAAAPAGAPPAATQTSASFVSGADAQGRATTDAGDLLREAPSATGVETQRRSPIANESRIRGYHLGQLITEADGEFWFPARQDLDTFLSKIDSGLVRDIIVLKGPYAARYGPGFAFIDIETDPTPRYEHGFEWHGSTLVNYKFNGQQLYGRQGVWGGDNNWGFNISYGQRTASNYETGDDTRIPSSYDSRDIKASIGISPSRDSRLEFTYLRLDQTDLDFPGQIFDTDFLVTNSYNLRYTLENQEYFDHFFAEGYYNRTSLHGNAQDPEKRQQIPALDALSFSGTTEIDQASTGYRTAVTWGKVKCPQLTVGTDFRHLDGELNERDSLFLLSGLPCFQGTGVSTPNFGIPRNHQNDWGFFVEGILPVNDRLLFKSGGRLDYAHTGIDSFPSGVTCTLVQNTLGSARLVDKTGEFDRDFLLGLAYATGEYKLNPAWTATAGIGHAERAPTETELYAMGPFLAILQQGFTTVIGNPDLNTEKLYQVDLGLKRDYGRLRLGLNGFYAFVNDYITYDALNPQQGIVKIPTSPLVNNALTVKFVNTDWATLSGFEAYGEADATDWLTPFATISFVEGRDQTRDHRGALIINSQAPFNVIPGLGVLGSPEEPLAGIGPLEARLGLRLHEACRNPRYGVEFTARLVAPQNRVATSLGELKSPGFTIYDLRSYWRVRRGVLLTAGIENLFDRFYREHLDLRTGLGVYQPGLNGYLGVQLTY